MTSLWKALTSSLGQKLVIGFTGAFLILFLMGHLAGNLLLYVGLEKFNNYATALHSNPKLLLVVEIILLIAFLLHVLLSIQVTSENRRARPVKYRKHRSKQGRTPVTASAIMFVSGTIVLGFILLHLADLHFNFRHQSPPETPPSTQTLLVLQDPISATVYFFGSLFLGYHIWHGFGSVFQTYGVNNARYTPWIKKISIILAILLGLGFASFPVWGMLLRLGVSS